MKLDALTAFTLASYRNIKLYFTSRLIEHNKTKKRIRILKNRTVTLRYLQSNLDYPDSVGLG